MKRRFSIMVNEGRDEYELCAVDNDPEPVAKVLAKMRIGRGKESVAKYCSVRIVDHAAKETA